jgi:hypothetical protein
MMRDITVKFLRSDAGILKLSRADVVNGVFGPRDAREYGVEPFRMAYHGLNTRENSYEFLFVGDPAMGFLEDTIEIYMPRKGEVAIGEGCY